MTSYRWPDFGAVDNKPRKRQQTIQRSAIKDSGYTGYTNILRCNGLRPVVNRIYHHVYHCCCSKYWHLSLKLMSYVHKRKLYKTRLTDKKPKLLALSWTNVSFSERLIGALRVRAANGMTKSYLTLDISASGKYGLLWEWSLVKAKNVWQED